VWRASGRAAVAAAGLLASAAAAEEQAADPGGDLGRMVYGAHCTICHGPSGGGDGPLAEFMTMPVPDLTTLTAANDGVFPFARIYSVIATGGAIGAHGGPDMPAWGERLLTDAYLLYGIEIAPAQREAFVQSRILALIDHIGRMQAGAGGEP
jgi:mono/diheme cytochrome c family protein